jgi:rod shape-determining protein MreB
MDWFYSTIVYVQVFRDRLLLCDGSSGKQLELTATFSHPRILIDDFPAAEGLLRSGLRQLKGSRWTPHPRVIVHPRELLEGGLSLIEVRVMLEVALGAGARDVVVWGGGELTVDAIRSFRFPPTRGGLKVLTEADLV